MFMLAYCASCSRISDFKPDLLEKVRAIAEVVPIDPLGPIAGLDFPVGPIHDLEVVRKLVEFRPEFHAGFRDEPLDVIRDAERFVH